MSFRVIFIALIAPLLTVSGQALALTTQEAVNQLKEMQNLNRSLIEKTDHAMSDQLKKSREIKAQNLTRPDNDTNFVIIEESIAQLQERKREYLLRHDFLNALTNKFASAFNGGDAREFIEKQLIELAATEVGIGSFEQPAGDEYWRFLTYLSVAIRELPEQIENPFKFTEAYMNFSTISNPKKPGEFRAQRNYFNSQTAESGKPLSTDKVDGDDNEPAQKIKAAAPLPPMTDLVPKPEQK